ncbi:MAG: hypothetical protein ABW106_08895 [Steroidobacteraceae bacterium]
MIAPIVGWLIRRYGARLNALVGLFGLSIGFMLAASITGNLWMLYMAPLLEDLCLAVRCAGRVFWRSSSCVCNCLRSHARYDIGFYVAALGFGLGALILLLLGPYPRRDHAAH